MALEAVGLTVGIVALLGVFEDCIDLLSRISSARAMKQDYQVLNTKVDLEKALLLQWADRVGLSKAKYDPRLDTQTGAHVLQALRSIQNIFRNAAILQDRYGLREADENTPTIEEASLVSRTRLETFKERLLDLTPIQRGQADRVKLHKAVRWAITDKEKFEKLTNDLTYFIEKVNGLVPDASGSVNEFDTPGPYRI